MREFEFGYCGDCDEALEVAGYFTRAWERVADAEKYPTDDDRARIRNRFVQAERAGWPIPRPDGGGYYETADELEIFVVETTLILNRKYENLLRDRRLRFQQVLSQCDGRTLSRAVLIDDQLCPVTSCSCLGQVLGFCREFTDPGE